MCRKKARMQLGRQSRWKEQKMQMPRAGQATSDRKVLWDSQETAANIMLKSCTFILALNSTLGSGTRGT